MQKEEQLNRLKAQSAALQKSVEKLQVSPTPHPTPVARLSARLGRTPFGWPLLLRSCRSSATPSDPHPPHPPSYLSLPHCLRCCSTRTSSTSCGIILSRRTYQKCSKSTTRYDSSSVPYLCYPLPASPATHYLLPTSCHVLCSLLYVPSLPSIPSRRKSSYSRRIGSWLGSSLSLRWERFPSQTRQPIPPVPDPSLSRPAVQSMQLTVDDEESYDQQTPKKSSWTDQISSPTAEVPAMDLTKGGGDEHDYGKQLRVKAELEAKEQSKRDAEASRPLCDCHVIAM